MYRTSTCTCTLYMYAALIHVSQQFESVKINDYHLPLLYMCIKLIIPCSHRTSLNFEKINCQSLHWYMHAYMYMCADVNVRVVYIIFHILTHYLALVS